MHNLSKASRMISRIRRLSPIGSGITAPMIIITSTPGVGGQSFTVHFKHNPFLDGPFERKSDKIHITTQAPVRAGIEYQTSGGYRLILCPQTLPGSGAVDPAAGRLHAHL